MRVATAQRKARRGVSESAGGEEDERAGLLTRDASGAELGLKGGVFGSWIEDDPAGLQSDQVGGEASGDRRAHVESDGVHRLDNLAEVREHGVTFDFCQGGMDEHNGVTVLEESAHGAVGVAVGLVAGTDDDNSFAG